MGDTYRDPDTGQDKEQSTEIPIEDGSEEKENEPAGNKTAGAEEVMKKADATDSAQEADAEDKIDSRETGSADAEKSGSTEPDASSQQTDAADSDGTEDKKGGFFSRNRKPDKEKAQMKEKIDSLEDRVRRQMAEFDNYRKRTEREKEESFSMGERSVIEKILPIVDNFERGFDTVEDSDKDDAFVTGMKKIYTQLMKQLTDLGVKPIEAVGKPFDPDFHNAVMQVDSDQYESGTVAQELQKGYTYHDQVIRHSMVAVVK